MCKAGHIQSKDDVIKKLEEAGLKITKVTGKAISIQNPQRPTGRAIRLTGALYQDEIWNQAKSATFNNKLVQKEFEEGRRDRLVLSTDKYNDFLGRRAEMMEYRYKSSKRPWENPPSNNGKSLNNIDQAPAHTDSEIEEIINQFDAISKQTTKGDYYERPSNAATTRDKPARTRNRAKKRAVEQTVSLAKRLQRTIYQFFGTHKLATIVQRFIKAHERRRQYDRVKCHWQTEKAASSRQRAVQTVDSGPRN
jgi:hypothetical protein